MLDRIDIHIEVIPVPFKELSEMKISERSAAIRERVVKARKLQEERFDTAKDVHCNAQMSSKQLRQVCNLDESGHDILKNAMDKIGLSARAYDRILKVARTIADLDNSHEINNGHLSEAINYRSLDRENWGK